ncbi:hypothetical protein [Gluconobacter oxydans]|uniref:hypothetical protein n=1 Tax=Gluconobacter oxydans TaxID=442 RepID=UPI002647F0BF|nr:hypothetical protein [Gluconobacter oxydans]WKE49716.1 hypothetical protein NUJ38_14325 [Gluconobacter oxydans]
MSRQTMHAVRQRRKALGLVQMNVWIHEDDKEDFQKAVAPFRDRGRQIEQDAREEPLEFVPFTYLVRFPVTPPAAVRNSMKASGWVYDRDGDVWKRPVSEENLEVIRQEAVTLTAASGRHGLRLALVPGGMHN